jgi:putative sterol carrier protein
MATAKDIIEKDIPAVLQKDPALAKDISSVVQFDITGEGGGKWTLDCTKTEGWISEGHSGTPKMTVSVSGDDFVKIREKKLNAQMAAMQGKLKFKPMDMGLAMKLAKLLG